MTEPEYTMSDFDEPAESAELAAVPDYPTDAVPGPLGDLVRAGFAAGLPAALVGGAGLGTAAAASMNATLNVSGDTWTEPPTVWVPLIAPPGGAKSPSLKFATGPLDACEADAHEIYRADLELWHEESKKERGDPPTEKTIVADDATLEALVRQLDTTKGTAAVISDELRGFLQGIGQYKKGGGSDQGRWLALWDGAPWRYKRVTNGVSVFVRRPVAPILGGIQPAYAHLLGPEEDGMRPRWLPHLSLTADIEPDGATRPVAWTRTIDDLYRAQVSREWHMGDGVRAAWKQAQRDWKQRSRTGVSAAVAAALHKADRQAARIALVLAETIDPGKGGALPPEAMTGALRIMEYVLGCWEAIPERETLTLTRTEERTMPAVDKLAAWLEQRPEARASKREISRAKVAGIRTKDALDAVLDQYTAVYPGTVQPGESTGGRPPVYVHAPRRRTRESDASSPKTPTDSRRDFVTGDKVPGEESGETPRENATSKTYGSLRDASEPFVTSGDKGVGDKVGGDKVPSPESTESKGSSDPAECSAPGCTNTPRRSCRTCADHMHQEGTAA